MEIMKSKTMPHKELDEKARVWGMTREQAREKVGMKKCWAKDCDTGVDNIFGLCYEHLCEFVESVESLDKRMPERELGWDYPVVSLGR